MTPRDPLPQTLYELRIIASRCSRCYWSIDC